MGPSSITWPALSTPREPSIPICRTLPGPRGEMGRFADRPIAGATEALPPRDAARAWRVINADAMIDSMQRAIEERAVETIARRQPVAIDLRQVVGILRIANELERIG